MARTPAHFHGQLCYRLDKPRTSGWWLLNHSIEVLSGQILCSGWRLCRPGGRRSTVRNGRHFLSCTAVTCPRLKRLCLLQRPVDDEDERHDQATNEEWCAPAPV